MESLLVLGKKLSKLKISKESLQFYFIEIKQLQLQEYIILKKSNDKDFNFPWDLGTCDVGSLMRLIIWAH